jgi:hypothetical protein
MFPMKPLSTSVAVVGAESLCGSLSGWEDESGRSLSAEPIDPSTVTEKGGGFVRTLTV